MLWQCCTQYASKFGKHSSGYRLEKISFHSNPKEDQCQRMFKLLHNCTRFTCQQSLKILQARLQQYVNWECPDVQAGFRKGRWVRNEIANIRWIIEKAREFQKTSTSASLIMLKALCGSQQTVGNSERAGNTRAPDLPEKPACRSKRNS